jgi:iron complex outermembrane recepter protein
VYRKFELQALSCTTAVLKRTLVSGAAISALLLGSVAFAQESGSGAIETVYVTGYRASLESALNVKRTSNTMVDAINAEDIAAFPDANLAESLQRLPGVAVDRDNGEGRTITVRGLNADFTRVTLNGLEALSTAGASTSGDDPNRSRQFDFNTFASELFSNLKVYKSSAAEIDEGSLGATVELNTGRPFDTGDKYVLSVQNATYEYGHAFNPRIAAVASHTFLGGRLGILGSIAYNMRNTTVNAFQSKPDTSSYIYRNMTFKGSSSTWRYGFAGPATTVDSAHCNISSATGVVPSTKIPYLPLCSALQGSDATAYGNVEGTGIATTASPGMATTLMPTLASLFHQELYQTRIGATNSVQWQATENTLVTFDGVFSSTYQNSTNYVLSPNGLNRNNTSSNLNKISATGTLAADKDYLYKYSANTGAFTDVAKCNDAHVAGYADVTCLTDTAGTQRFAFNHDLYNYYSQAGTNPNAAEAALISFIGRPSTKLVSAHVSPSASGSLTSAISTGVVDQMTLANVDDSVRTDEANYTTQFMQGSLSVNHNFSERLRAEISAGMSVSRNHQVGYLVELNKLDSGSYNGTTCTGCLIYDATAEDESMPFMDFGFDTADSSNWSLVKGYSYFKHYMTNTTNKYRSFKASVAYDVSDQFTLKAGFSGRIYDFATTKYSRVMKDQYGMPSISELQGKYGASFSVADLGRVVSWGTGLNVPSGMNISGFFAPDLAKFKQYLHIDCNCVDPDFGDWGISNQFSAASTSVTGNTYNVSEHDKSGYVQVDFKDIMILGRELRGNAGVRIATTSVNTVGHGTVGNVITGKNYYANVLPSVNLAYSLSDDMLLRASASKAIARPQLATMAPSITSFTIDTTGNDGNGLTIGNTKLKPYNATTVDVGYEWYFNEGSVFAITGFTKFIKDVPQQVTTAGYLNQYMDLDSFNQLLYVYQNVPGMVSTTNATAIQNSYNQVPGYRFTATMYKNARGGVLNGLEFTYQQVLTFLPDPFDSLGINANYTLIHSRMHYIINPESTPGAGNEVDGDAAWTGASPIAFNVTMFYDGKDWWDHSWSGRVSVAYRSKYVSQYPITGGDAAPGTTNNPIMNDLIYSKSTLNIDTAFTYDYSDKLQFRVDALNLTNQTDNRFAFAGLPTVTKYASTGRQIFAGIRFKY